jgi:hypothetical protein
VGGAFGKNILQIFQSDISLTSVYGPFQEEIETRKAEGESQRQSLDVCMISRQPIAGFLSPLHWVFEKLNSQEVFLGGHCLPFIEGTCIGQSSGSSSPQYSKSGSPYRGRQ